MEENAMGTIIKGSCAACGYEKKLFAGCGKSDCNLSAIMSSLTEGEQHKLSDAISNGAKYITIDRKPCFCTFCKEINVIPFVRFFLNDKEYFIRGSCPSCRNKEYETPRYCPSCGAELTFSEIGLWD